MLKQYLDIFNELIGRHLKESLIFKYDSFTGSHEYTPFFHFHDYQTEKRIGEFMRKYIFLYAYSENEVIQAYNKGRLANLEFAAKHALRERLPNRSGSRNGLYSELLLDLLLVMYRGNINKLATRAIYRQRTDNQEIKGFDGMHIVTNDNNNHELWFGQAKMGSLGYCLSDIEKDLINKTNIIYASEQLYFIADKEYSTLENSLALLDRINDISWSSENSSLSERAQQLKSFFIREKLKIVFPCLLAYSSPGTYEIPSNITNEIKNETHRLIQRFDSKFSSLIDIDYSIYIWFIPIRDLELIRKSVVAE
ncbi:uncharacterized protein DUF1837 [Paenibacillus taihuensis]|uniref:Uncharacterized protein DUF1837 n=1 Tax=Paenibacillus taihuensis TaxID=1156355 RepID=A0A3D9SBF5_9BACL|nr:Hachiman antiphage defense system protein HamA [Paenibacillus taihuensis]REE90610.1 uncharacterized protein DUF1837 [Paenibacillus taihuensis]